VIVAVQCTFVVADHVPVRVPLEGGAVQLDQAIGGVVAVGVRARRRLLREAIPDFVVRVVEEVPGGIIG